MTLLKKLAYGIIGLFFLIVVVGLMLPTEYNVDRSVTINAEPAAVYPQIVNLKAWSQWSVWFMRDPRVRISYGGPDRAIGMRATWLSKSHGNGEMQITHLVYNKRMVYSLYLTEYETGSTGQITLEPVAEGTRVTWTGRGEVGANPMDRYYALIIGDTIGSDVETGLDNLKTVVENQG